MHQSPCWGKFLLKLRFQFFYISHHANTLGIMVPHLSLLLATWRKDEAGRLGGSMITKGVHLNLKKSKNAGIDGSWITKGVHGTTTERMNRAMSG